ncbi:MAG: ATP-binding protein [Anaerolineaceae bacterium]
MTRIDETLRKIADDTLRANSRTSSTIEPAEIEPVCPICGGVGYVRRDLPITDPNFGKLQLCVCQEAAAKQSLQDRNFRSSNLEAFQEMTFEDFKIQGRLGLGEDQVGSLRYALNQAQHFSKEINGWLLLQGGYGCGKTHLAAAVANYAVSQGMPVLFLTVPDLLDWLRFAYDAPEASFEQRFDEIRSINLLVLDDLGTQNTTAWAQEKLFQIINYRYINRLPVVVTTNLDLAELDGRIKSRLQDPDLVTVVKINSPDYRLPIFDSTQNQRSALTLLSGCTFGSFSMRETEKLPPEEQQSIAKAFRAAQQFAENPQGWLVLSGSYGAGKTHLAASIGNYCTALGMQVVFWVVPDLLDYLRATFGPNATTSYDRSFEEVKRAPLLILDDLGTQSTTPWAKEKLFQLFNYRYIAGLPTVITTSSLMEDIDKRLRSRILDARLCAVYAVIAPPYRGVSSPASQKPRRAKTTGGY